MHQFSAQSSPGSEALTSASGRSSDQHTVPIGELLTQRFLSRHTRYTSVEAFLLASQLNPVQLIELGPKSRALWDHFVRHSSDFPDLHSLLREARSEWLVRRLGIGVDA